MGTKAAARCETVFLGAHHANELPSSGEDLLKLSDLGVGDGSRGGADGLREVSEHESVQSIGFGQATSSLGEVSRLARIDHKVGHSRGGQGRGNGTLEASAGFQDHKSLSDYFRQLAHELIDSCLVVRNDEVLSGREDGNIDGGLGDIYAYVGSSSTSSGYELDNRP
jgi:hypothetical protein